MATRNLPIELSTLNLPDSGETTLPPSQCIAGTIGSQTDLPSSVAVGTIGNTAIRQFFWLKP